MQPVLDLVPQRRPDQGGLHQLGHVALEPVDFWPEGHVVEDGLGKGLGRWNTIPIWNLISAGIDVLGVKVLPVEIDLPVVLAVGINSFMRLKHRNSVLLPQPEGPMMAVIWLLGTSRLTSVTARLAP